MLVLCFDIVVSIEVNEGRNNLMLSNAFGKSVSDSNEKNLQNFSQNEVISTLLGPNTLKKRINVDVKQKVTASSPDNDYQLMKRAFDTFNEKMDLYMNFYGSEMTFLTTKLNNLKEKLNTLEILQHEIDQVMNKQNTNEQKLQIIQESISGSQSINSKLDRLELSVQQLNVRIDELTEKQRKFSLPNVQKKHAEEQLSENDEQFKNCESKIEQLVGFVHSFAELNRLESTDILNRLGNMQSQLIQFFDVKGPIVLNQRNATDTILHEIEMVEETTQHSNDTNALKDAIEINSSEVNVTMATEIPSTLVNVNDDGKLSTSNPKFNRKRKRTTNMVS